MTPDVEKTMRMMGWKKMKLEERVRQLQHELNMVQHVGWAIREAQQPFTNLQFAISSANVRRPFWHGGGFG